MDIDPVVDLVTFDSQVTAFVPNDDPVSGLAPLSRGVEALIDPSVETEGLLTYTSSKSQVAKTFQECGELSKLRVTPTHPVRRGSDGQNMNAWP